MYHGVTQIFDNGSRRRGADGGAPRLGRAEDEEGRVSGGGDEEASPRKERVLHTRVPAVLERELKRLAESLRVPVSNLVRAVLEDAVAVADHAGENVETRLKSFAENLEHERDKLRRRVMRDPLEDVIAFQAVKLAQPTPCAKCKRELRRGEGAHLGLRDEARPVAGRVFVCDGCVPSE